MKKHQNTCGRHDELAPLLPSRVIDVGKATSNKVFLYESPAGQRGTYMCLSYCWGRSNFIKSTGATVQRHMTRGIALRDLPRVFQDAIGIVRAFQVRYLWIDSLCIIQDCKEDCDKESARMAEVYSNSFLTIAATRAANPDESLFSTRGGCTTASVRVQHFRHFPNTQSAKNTQNFPLLSRGWTYQERILPPRVLHFGPDEVLWDCRGDRQCECGEASHYLDEVEKANFFRCTTTSPSTDLEAQRRQKVWRLVVVQYTALDLTHPSDIFPALSGLAEAMRASTGEDYLAGLWSGSLSADLLWYQNKRGSYPGAAGRDWRAPSWSWASIDGSVMYHHSLYTKQSGSLDFIQHCQVINAECIPAGESQTGRITSGHIKLRCQVVKAVVKGRRVMPESCYTMPHLFPHFDRDFKSFHNDDVYDVYLCRIAKVSHIDYSILLEVDNLEDQMFRRIGLVEHYGEQTWPQETRVITIV
ncbi:HET-domain-containing protein [Echria macrotheca]|uniref:HET-domain-containing protein n=1 Tax=Echria macrotheca TaxID=438768 RepID=A0AAJ0BBV9_9PEZI|nr:HET-domain-containing protein [Echria macrotheca]